VAAERGSAAVEVELGGEGGVGNAAKALGGYVASLVTPVTVAAAAIGGIGYAAYAGSTEMDEFKKNLILTGNISGITADKFNAMAQSMANIGGITRGAAAEALTAMAASGNIGAESIERLTRSALQFEKAGGPAVADTVKQFEALGKEPVKASVELSEKTHYLTLAVYEQIKSLEEQGKASEAAALAQKTWADAIDQRTPQMVQNLGYIESAWKGIKEAAAGAWDSAKSLGREETDLEKRVALLRKIGQANLDIESGSINSNRLKQQKEQWAQELKALVDSNNAKEAEAKKHAAEEAKNKAQIDAAVKYDKLIDDQASKAVKQRKEMQLLDADRAAGLVSEEKYQQAKAAIAKKYEEKGSSRPKVDKAALEAQREAERQQERLNGLLEVGSGVSKTYTADVALLGKALAGGKITTEQYSASASKLWLTQTEAGKAFKASSEAAKDAANAMTAWRSEHESQLAAIAEETSAVGQSAESRKIAIAGLQVEADAKKRIASLNDKLSADARKSAENEINAERDKQKAYVETALRKQQAVEGAYQLEQENRRFAADSILDEKQRAQVILDIDAETWRQRIELAEVGSEERRRLEGAFAQWYSNQLSKPAIESMRKALESIDQTFHTAINCFNRD
jgi:phage-related minor tail protein